jgi:hypothetical protein
MGLGPVFSLLSCGCRGAFVSRSLGRFIRHGAAAYSMAYADLRGEGSTPDALPPPISRGMFTPHFSPHFMWDVGGFGKTVLDDDVARNARKMGITWTFSDRPGAQSGGHTFRQHVVPHPPGPVGSIAGEEAGANLRAQLLIAPAALTARPCQPGIEPTPRDTERPAQPFRRPDPPVPSQCRRTSRRLLREVGRGFF